MNVLPTCDPATGESTPILTFEVVVAALVEVLDVPTVTVTERAVHLPVRVLRTYARMVNLPAGNVTVFE